MVRLGDPKIYNKMAVEQIFQLISAAVTICLAFLGLSIKNALGEMKLQLAGNKEELINKQTEIKEELTLEQNKIKEELVLAQTKVRSELVEHNALLSQTLAVHIATDEVRFKNLENVHNVQVNVQK